MKVKDVILDKSVSTSDKIIKTGKTVLEATKSSVGTTTRAASDIVVNHGSDLYDRHNDVAGDTAKQLASNSTMVARNVYRVGRSTKNIETKRKIRTRYNYGFTEGRFNKTETQRKAWKKLKRAEKRVEYGRQGVRKGLKPVESTKKTFRNQTRRIVNKGANNEDTATRGAGKGLKAIYASIRYRKDFIKTLKLAVGIVKGIASAISSLISLIASIPGLIVTIVTTAPILIILVVIICICALFDDLEYTGRVAEFVSNEVYLEYRYDVNVAPDEVLAITSVLGWNTHEIDDYEAIFALMMDGKDENWNISFDKMCDNVFNKYNPAIHKWVDGDIRVKRKGLLGDYVPRAELYKDDYLNCYPKYKKMSVEEKKAYGSEENIKKMKAEAKEVLDRNARNYIGDYIVTSMEENIFTSRPLDIKNIAYGSSSSKMGFRSFRDGVFHNGTDIAVANGTPVYAVASAKVLYAEDGIKASGDVCDTEEATEKTCGKNLAGNQVVLQLNVYDRETGERRFLNVAYYHLKNGSVKVKTNDKIASGQQVGEVGDSGISYGAHLHFQAWLTKSSKYDMPYSTSNTDYDIWQQYIDATMLCDIEFRNHIYGR